MNKGGLDLKDLVEVRAAMLGEYIVENEATVRAAAKAFGVSRNQFYGMLIEK